MTTPHRIGRRRAGSATHVACAAMIAACAATPAQADSLTTGRAVTPPGVVVGDFSVATSRAGGRVALLYHAARRGGDGRELLFARLGRGRNLGPALALEDRVAHSGAKQVSTYGARVAVGADGRAVAAWVARGREASRDQLRVATAPHGRRFGPARTVSRAAFRQGFVPEIKVMGAVAGPGRRDVVSWALGRSPTGSLRAAVRTRGGRFGAPQTLGSIAVGFASPSALVLAPSGTVVAAWIRPAARNAAAATTLPAGRRRFGATRLISRADAAGHVQAVAGPGGAAVSWSDDRRTSGPPIRLRLARLRRDGTLATPATIAEVDTAGGALEVDGPQVAFPLAGPVAAWQVFRDISEAGDGRINSTRIDAADSREAGFLAPLSLSTAGAPTRAPVVGALTDRALVAWPERVAPDRWRLRLAVRRSGRAWRPPLTVADTNAAIAIAAGTRSALLLWNPFDIAREAERGRLRLAVYRR